MQPYTAEFALVYDILMDHNPYGEWAEYISGLFVKEGIESGLVLELCCGTGNMTRRMSDKGYDMIGIDSSEDMLSIAEGFSEGRNDGILYLCQDIREFELYGTVSAAFCVCDSMNYMLSEEDLLKVFKLVDNYLDPGGLFIFDMDTPYAYAEVLADTTAAMNREEGSFIWENTFYPDEMVNEVNLTVFLPRAEPDGRILYQMHEETHIRKAYSLTTIRNLLEEAGMEWVAAVDSSTKEEVRANSERIYIIAREKRKGVCL